MANVPRLVPDNQFPKEAIQQSVQEFPKADSVIGGMVFTWNIATVADAISPWGRSVGIRDRQLRDFWPTEPYLAGAVANVSFRNAATDWKIRHSSNAIEQAVTDMLNSAIAGSSFGWEPFALKISEDGSTQDNGFFVELIRDPGMDASSRFKDERAPVLGISHLDANQCTRTGDPEFPVVYTDRKGGLHKLAWYQVIPFSDFPSSIEKMNGVGYSAVTRTLRLGQIMRSICIYKDEKITGRHYKQIHFVSGVSRQDIKDEMKRGQEDADNKGQITFLEPAILASLDPERPVSTATIDLANLPDGFDFDQEMKWYISGLALGFGVDYQEFAPLPGGGIGSSNQSVVLSRKASGKGPAMFMKIAQAFKNYGVLPRGCEMVFEVRDEEKELAKAELRKLFQEEMALGLRNGFLPPDAARKIGISRGIYEEKELIDIPKEYGDDMVLPKQTIGGTGGNTIAEDAGRTNVGTPNNTGGERLRKEEIEEVNKDRQDERRSFIQVIRDVVAATKNPKVEKERPVQPIVNLDVHNHPGKAPVIKFNPELKSTTRLIMPVQRQDNGSSKAIDRIADAIGKQKPPDPPIVNVDVKSPDVHIHNEIKPDDQKADRKEFMEKVRKIAKRG